MVGDCSIRDRSLNAASKCAANQKRSEIEGVDARDRTSGLALSEWWS